MAPDVLSNSASSSGRNAIIYKGEEGYCPAPRQHNQEFTLGNYGDKPSLFCNSRPDSRSSDFLKHPIHSTSSSNSFPNAYEPTLQPSDEGRRFIGVLGSPNREHGILSFQSTTSRNDELVDLSPTNSPSSRGFSSNKVLHQASEKLLKTQNLAKRHQSAYAERVSTFQVLPVDLGVLEARMKGTMLTLYTYRSRTTTKSDPKPISSNNLPQALHRFQVQAIPHSLRSTHIPRMLVR